MMMVIWYSAGIIAMLLHGILFDVWLSGAAGIGGIMIGNSTVTY